MAQKVFVFFKFLNHQILRGKLLFFFLFFLPQLDFNLIYHFSIFFVILFRQVLKAPKAN
jgi:hypothetical protein